MVNVIMKVKTPPVCVEWHKKEAATFCDSSVKLHFSNEYRFPLKSKSIFTDTFFRNALVD